MSEEGSRHARPDASGLIKLLAQVDEGRHPRSSVTVDEVLHKWLEVAELEDTTRQRYEGLIRRYIQPTFGERAVGKLDAEMLERFYARLRHCRRLCARPSADHECKPLSGSSVRRSRLASTSRPRTGCRSEAQGSSNRTEGAEPSSRPNLAPSSLRADQAVRVDQLAPAVIMLSGADSAPAEALVERDRRHVLRHDVEHQANKRPRTAVEVSLPPAVLGAYPHRLRACPAFVTCYSAGSAGSPQRALVASRPRFVHRAAARRLSGSVRPTAR